MIFYLKNLHVIVVFPFPVSLTIRLKCATVCISIVNDIIKGIRCYGQGVSQ